MDNKLELQHMSAQDEIGLSELFQAVWQAKFWIGGSAVLATILMVFYSLSLPNIYRSEALLTPVEDSSSKLGSLAGQFGGLASLAGVNLGKGDANKTLLALETLKSREFFQLFSDKHSVLLPLMAAKSWDPASNKLIFDEDIYNQQTGTWVRKAAFPRQSQPSMQEAYDTFKKIFNVSQDKATGLIRVSVEHLSPYVASEWVSILVAEVNEEMRKRDIKEAQDSIAYLEAQIIKTNITEIKSVLYELIEEQTKTLMLANVRPEYVFKTVDSAIVPELKYKPGRAVMVIATFILVLIAGFGFVLLRLVMKKEQ